MTLNLFSKLKKSWKKRSFRWTVYAVILFYLAFFTFLFQTIFLVGVQVWGLAKSGDKQRFDSNIEFILKGAFFRVLHSLPSDDEMLQLLSDNKADFERLVKLTQEDSRTRKTDEPDSLWSETDEGRNLKNKLGIRMTYTGAAWLPDPYSLDSDNRIANLIKLKSPELAQYLEIRITLNGSSMGSPRFGLLEKSYLYTPEIPLIKDGWFVDSIGKTGEVITRYKIASTLDWYWFYPWNWGRDKVHYCIIRRTDSPNWFITLCRSL